MRQSGDKNLEFPPSFTTPRFYFLFLGVYLKNFFFTPHPQSLQNQCSDYYFFFFNTLHSEQVNVRSSLRITSALRLVFLQHGDRRVPKIKD